MGKDIKKKRSLELARFTIQCSADAIIFHDSQGEILKANDSACRHLGYSENELMSLTIQDINPDSNKKTWSKFWKKLKRDKIISFEVCHKTKKGLFVPTDVVVNYVEFDGREYAVSFSRDISARKRIEEEKQRTFEELSRLREQLQVENEYLQEEVLELQAFGDIVGKSPALQTILRQIEMVAPTDASSLIAGESGTGKELIALEIHNRSSRNRHAMVRVNCASIPRELYESEFFGHIKGAFTGAVRDRVGRFDLANQGTLFLDEVGEIPLDLQSKLLRVLQEGTFERVGDEKTRSVDVRIIAASNRDLKVEVERGNFREDLYYRLNVFPITVPPLRKRIEDIPLLAAYFLKLSAKKFKKPEPQLTRSNTLQLTHYDWPGNVRELQNIIERSVIISQKGKLKFDLPKTQTERKSTFNLEWDKKEDQNILTFAEIRSLDQENILKALKKTGGKIFGKDGAAQLLETPPTTLISRMKKMKIAKTTILAGSPESHSK
jgi:PAS domain S-box-containing protein